MRTPITTVFVLTCALLACKSKKPEPAPAPPPAPPDPAAQEKQRRRSLGSSDFRALCDGKSAKVADAEPRPAGKSPRVLTFMRDVTKSKDAAYELYKSDGGFMKNHEAADPPDASLVACVDITKKTKKRDCTLTGVSDPSKMSTVTMYDADFHFRVIEAQTGKVLSDEKKALKTKPECPTLTIAKTGASDELPIWEASLSLLVDKAK